MTLFHFHPGTLARGLAVALSTLSLPHMNGLAAQTAPTAIRKIKDVVIYQDAKFYASFPSIVRRPGGELLVAFRRAPDWVPFGSGGYSHTDPNSYLVLVRSKDSGESWTRDPEIFFAHPFGGSQDPCMVQLRDGTILCSSYGWSLLPTNGLSKLKMPVGRHGNFVFIGGYVLRSRDGGDHWQGPIVPPASPAELHFDLFGHPVPAYNRGAMCQGKDGRIYWVVATTDQISPAKTSTHLMISADNGVTWNYSCPVAQDPKITFNETSLYETPKGDLVAFMRTGNFDDHTCIARSSDHGKSFQWRDASFQGHPHFALRLPDKRVLLVYGYRHAPFGVRARVLDPECNEPAAAEEIILRDDGGNGDLGYPWATMISKHRALVVYYFNRGDGTRHIAGTFLEVN